MRPKRSRTTAVVQKNVAAASVPSGWVADESVFQRRLDQRQEELRALYNTIYPNDQQAYEYFVAMLHRMFLSRKEALHEQDAQREQDPQWFKAKDFVGMMLYTNAFGGTLQGVKEKLGYLNECGVNYLHLMPLLLSPEGRSDGGYAVADFRTVQPQLGTMEDLEALADACRAQDTCLCLDFVMNHTSEDHEWAQKALAGEPGYRERYFFYDNWDIPNRYEETVPQVFPTTAPGNFTWLEDCQQVVMTTFYPYQWDLNYANPVVMNDMTENLLYLTNRGIDVIRLDAVPYIWKELGTSCRNLPMVHTMVRLMRLACEIVCPSVLMLGEVVMEPAKVVPYFGSTEKPECHMLYNVTTMATTWHTLATGDVSLLRRQLDTVCALPKEFLFLNYLRCHDDIGWGLDYAWLNARFGTDEVAHKRYLNQWFPGQWPGSVSRGELYNDDPRLGDARLCGTTASLCGLETACDAMSQARAVGCDLMLHAWMFTQSGIPVLYSGDEVGQCNDYSYHQDPNKCADSRYLHRGDFPWEAAEQRHVEGTVENQLFYGLRRLETLRAQYPCFQPNANVWTFDTGSPHVLGVGRWYNGCKLMAFFNFGGSFITATCPEPGDYHEVMYDNHYTNLNQVGLYPYGFAWMIQSHT